MKHLLALFVVMSVILVACAGASEPTEQAEPTLAPTMAVTYMPTTEPTVTPVPTNKPKPTATPIETPRPTPSSNSTPTVESISSSDEGLIQPTVSYDLPSLDGIEIHIAVENAWPPFNFVDEETGEATGYDYDLFTEICARINCRPVFVETNWEQFTGLLDGSREFEDVDIGADGITITDERAQHVDFSDPYIQLSHTLLIRADEDRFSNADEFKANADWLVGSQLGTTNYDVAVDLVGEERITAYDQFPIAVQALINGDVDAVVMDNVAGLGYVNANPNAVKITRDVLTGEKLGFIFAKGNGLRDTINEVLAEMDEDGTMDELFQKWFIDFEPGG